jgi:hypothetical protein
MGGVEGEKLINSCANVCSAWAGRRDSPPADATTSARAANNARRRDGHPRGLTSLVHNRIEPSLTRLVDQQTRGCRCRGARFLTEEAGVTNAGLSPLYAPVDCLSFRFLLRFFKFP